MNSLSEICILFLHYKNDDVTFQNYNLIKKYNPNKNIYSIGFENHDLINNSHVVYRKQSYPQNKNLNETCKKEYWSEADLLIYDFYINNPNFSKYFIIEWDTYCNCSLEDFYGNSLNMSNFSHCIADKENLESWYWYTQLSDFQKLISNIGGIGPTTCLFFIGTVLSSIVNRMLSSPRIYDNMFSELRLGTLLKQSGYTLNKPFLNSESYINWNIDYIKFDSSKPGYYHPIKTII
jgi:hypothetical protein